MADQLLVARVTTTIVHQGRNHRIRKGETVVHADDPVVQGREKLFRPLAVTQLGRRPARAEETATAGPGERRDLRLPSVGGAYDPAADSVAQVNDYLAGADADERARVLQAECDGKARRGIIQGPYSDLSGT